MFFHKKITVELKIILDFLNKPQKMVLKEFNKIFL